MKRIDPATGDGPGDRGTGTAWGDHVTDDNDDRTRRSVPCAQS